MKSAEAWWDDLCPGTRGFHVDVEIIRAIQADAVDALQKENEALRDHVAALERIVEKGGHIGYGSAVTAEIERQQAKVATLEEENARLRKEIPTGNKDALELLDEESDRP